MKPEVKALLIAELASGAWRKTRHSLIGDDGMCYCVTGVLCELATRAGVPIERAGGAGYGYRIPGLEKVYITYPPYPVLDWAGISELAARLLADVNDRHGDPDSWADVIEYIREM